MIFRQASAKRGPKLALEANLSLDPVTTGDYHDDREVGWRQAAQIKVVGVSPAGAER